MTTKVGLHISTAGDAYGAMAKAEASGMTAVQIFAGNPRSFVARKPPDKPYPGSILIVVHGSYVINFGDPTEQTVSGAISQVNYAAAIGAPYVIFHAGSSKSQSRIMGLARLSDSLGEVLSNTSESVTILLENMAHGRPGCSLNDAGSLGSLSVLLQLYGANPRLKFCYDTAHAYGAGESICDLIKIALSAGSLDQFPILHLNNPDTGVTLGSHLDRHSGKINEGAQDLGFLMATVLAFNPKAVILESMANTQTEVSMVQEVIRAAAVGTKVPA